MRFPLKVKFRKAEARIYGKSRAYGYYRVCGTVNGKRRMTSFHSYGEAKSYADKLVRDIAAGSKVDSLTRDQANDAVIALNRLDRLFRDTRIQLSLPEAVDGFCAATAKLGGRPLGEAVDGFLSGMATVRRVDLGQAVEEFIAGRKHLAESKDGKRPKHSPRYEHFVASWLREFAQTFPGHAVCDLSKQGLNAYIGKFEGLAPKTRNDRRACVKMFLRWTAAQDYLSQTHRLFEAVGFKPEDKDTSEIDYYRPGELRAMLEAAAPDLLPVVALAGLAGIRIEECLRLEWADVFHADGHVEISAAKSKTRARRLVTICPALAQWLEPFRNSSGRVCGKTAMGYKNALAKLRKGLGVPARRNGLRHAFVTYHMALYANENLTAAEAGNSPAMIHSHYKGLATKEEAGKWFNVAPATAENVIQLTSAAQK